MTRFGTLQLGCGLLYALFLLGTGLFFVGWLGQLGAQQLEAERHQELRDADRAQSTPTRARLIARSGLARSLAEIRRQLKNDRPPAGTYAAPMGSTDYNFEQEDYYEAEVRQEDDGVYEVLVTARVFASDAPYGDDAVEAARCQLTARGRVSAREIQLLGEPTVRMAGP